MEKRNILVCVTGQLSCERLIIAGAKLAEETQGQVYVLHVARTGKSILGFTDEPEALEYLFGVSAKHDADMVVIKNDDVKGTIERQARALDVGTIVSGRAAGYNGWDLLDELRLRMPDVKFKIMV